MNSMNGFIVPTDKDYNSIIESELSLYGLTNYIYINSFKVAKLSIFIFHKGATTYIIYISKKLGDKDNFLYWLTNTFYIHKSSYCFDSSSFNHYKGVYQFDNIKELSEFINKVKLNINYFNMLLL